MLASPLLGHSSGQLLSSTVADNGTNVPSQGAEEAVKQS